MHEFKVVTSTDIYSVYNTVDLFKLLKLGQWVVRCSEGGYMDTQIAHLEDYDVYSLHSDGEYYNSDKINFNKREK